MKNQINASHNIWAKTEHARRIVNIFCDPIEDEKIKQ